MKITSFYKNSLYLNSLISPLTAKLTENLVTQTYLLSNTNFKNKISSQLFSKNSAVALTQLNKSAADLAKKAKNLTLTDPFSIFNDRTAISSDTTVLTATAYNALSLTSGATAATYSINITTLAQAQKNIGTELVATAPTAVSTGTNTFNINIKGISHKISFDMVAGDTNDIVLQKMTTTINKLNIGVTATVSLGKTTGTKQLILKADDTGAANAFTISDITGNAVAATGAGTVSLVAQDAAYTVNGISDTSSSNTIFLDKEMVTVNLKSLGKAILTVGPDKTKVKDTISTFVSEINGFIDFLNKNSSYIKDEVHSKIKTFITDHKAMLDSYGITQGADGKLTIDSVKLATATAQNMKGIKRTFAGINGLAVRINNYASHISSDSPINYAKEAPITNIAFSNNLYVYSGTLLQQSLLGSIFSTYI